MTRHYTLTMTEEHAVVLTRACDCYMRLLMGQFGHVADHAMKEMENLSVENVCAFRDQMERLGPMLTGLPLHATKGIFHPHLHHDAKMAHDLGDVVRHRLSYDREPGGGHGVHFRDPMQAADIPLPEIAAIEPANS